MEVIATQLGVDKTTISRDLVNCCDVQQLKPPKTASNPKGAGSLRASSPKGATEGAEVHEPRPAASPGRISLHHRCRERPRRRRSADERDESAPVHSITSSASES